MSKSEKSGGIPKRKFAPSAEKILSEEADNPNARANADLFVEGLYLHMDQYEYGPNALVPTPRDITAKYKEVQAKIYQPEGQFSLQAAYSAAKRKLLFQKELAAEWGERGSSSITMRNIGDMYIVMTTIELALPVDKRPSNENV